MPRSLFHSAACAGAPRARTVATVVRRLVAARLRRGMLFMVELPGSWSRGCRDQDATEVRRVAVVGSGRAVACVTPPRSTVQPHGRAASRLAHHQLCRDAVAHLGHMTDHANDTAAVAQ